MTPINELVRDWIDKQVEIEKVFNERIEKLFEANEQLMDIVKRQEACIQKMIPGYKTGLDYLTDTNKWYTYEGLRNRILEWASEDTALERMRDTIPHGALMNLNAEIGNYLKLGGVEYGPADTDTVSEEDETPPPEEAQAPAAPEEPGSEIGHEESGSIDLQATLAKTIDLFWFEMVNGHLRLEDPLAYPFSNAQFSINCKAYLTTCMEELLHMRYVPLFQGKDETEKKAELKEVIDMNFVVSISIMTDAVWHFIQSNYVSLDHPFWREALENKNPKLLEEK